MPQQAESGFPKQHGRLPFHLSSLDFDIDPSRLSLLSSEQLALAQFHPDATDIIKAKAEILFFKRRAQDAHLLESVNDSGDQDGHGASCVQLHDNVAATTLPTGSAGRPLDRLQAEGLHGSAATAEPVISMAKEEVSMLDDLDGTIQISEQCKGGHRVEVAANLLLEQRKASTEKEEGEMSDSAKTPMPEAVEEQMSGVVKREPVDDDLVLLDGPGRSASRSDSLRRSTSLALNMGATYSGKRYKTEQMALSVLDSRASTSRSASDRLGTDVSTEDSRSAQKRKGGTRERKQSSKKRRARAPASPTSSRKSSRHSRPARDERADPRRSREKRPRARSFSSSESSYSSSSSRSERSGSSSSDYSDSCSSSSGSYSSSRSRSTPERRHHRSSSRRRRSGRSSRRNQVQYVMPAPGPFPMQTQALMQMQMPAGMQSIPAGIVSEEELSRQQVAHMYRNMPSNPEELRLRSSMPFAESPPRPAQNNFAFPGQPTNGYVGGPPPHQPAPQTMQNGGPSMHPARLQAISSGQGPSPMAGSSHSFGGTDQRPPVNFGRDFWGEDPATRPPRRNNQGPFDSRPSRGPPNAGGQGDPWANAPSRPRQPQRNGSAAATSSGWGNEPSSKASSNPWGDDSSTSTANAIGKAGGDPWGSPDAAPPRQSNAGGSGKSKANASVWGDEPATAMSAQAAAGNPWGDSPPSRSNGNSNGGDDPWG